MSSLNISEVSAIVKSAIPEFKKIDAKKMSFGRVFKSSERDDQPNFHPTYLFEVDMYNRIRVHSELSGFPESLFMQRAPRMTDEELAYIRNNYKQVTLPVYLDFLSSALRIFHEPNYSIEYQNDDKPLPNESSLQQYLENEIPVFGSLESFMKTIVVHAKLTDANGVIAVRPEKLKTTVSDNGDKIIDDSVLQRPIPMYYRCDQVVEYVHDEYCLIVTDRKSDVVVGDKKQKTGWIFEVYDDENIWMVEQYGKKEDYKFRAYLYYSHKCEKVPVIKLKGVPAYVEGRLVWISPFRYAVDLLDLVATNSSFLQIIINNCVFPYRVMYGDECEYEYVDQLEQHAKCQDGYVYDSKLESKIICPGCKGAGLKSRVSTLGVMLIRSGASGDAGLSQHPMEFIEPTVETPKFVMSKISDDENKARRILHLNTTTSQIQGGVEMMNPAANTATGMALDTKAKDAFTKPISDQIFEIYEFIIEMIGMQRDSKRFKKPIITTPKEFDFYTEQDYMNNIANAVKSGLPPFVIQTILFKYLQSVFYNEAKTVKVFDLIYNTDRLITMSSDDITMKLSRGLIDRWEVVLHDSALIIIKKMVSENEKFLELDFIEQQNKLIESAKAIAESMPKEKKLYDPNSFS